MPYCVPNDVLARYDNRIVGDLTSDSGTRNSPTELQTDPILLALISSATGEINQSVLQGERYNVAELEALTGDDQAILVDLCAALTFKRLRLRRGMPLDGFPQIEAADNMLKALREGYIVFNIPAVEEAGLPQSVIPSNQYYANLNLLRDRATVGYFTPRRIQREQVPYGSGT